jgi:hypothetical protein
LFWQLTSEPHYSQGVGSVDYKVSFLILQVIVFYLSYLMGGTMLPSVQQEL